MDKQEFLENLEKVDNSLNVNFIEKVMENSLREVKNNKKGTENLIIVMEELSELSQQISKYIRGKDNKEDLLEELADVYIGILYVQNICKITEEELNKAINVKITRQNLRNDIKA